MLILERHAVTLSQAAYWLEDLSFWELDLILLYNKVLPRWISSPMFTKRWVSAKIVWKHKQWSAWFLSQKQ